MLVSGILLATLGATPSDAAAQQRDSLRVAPAGALPRGDTLVVPPLPEPPVSPRRALLTSMAFPGYGQARLDRSTASALFFAIEVAGVYMVRKSLDDLHTAKRLGRDSLPARYDVDPVTGQILRDPVTGEPLVLEWLPPAYSQDLVRARRLHLEDWVAALVFNHLIAGADAYVAAHLWDVPAAVSLRALPTSRGAMVVASLRW